MLVEQDGRLESWVFHREGGERLSIRYLDEGFQDLLRELQAGGGVLIPEGVVIGKDISLLISLSRGSNI